MEYDYKFTVFTSCYNSVKFLDRLYQSLEKQTYKNFEWLIIDDYSTDQTKELISSIKKKASFDINAFFNDSNKMISYCCNSAVKKAKGEFFLFLDHDDEIVPKALETFSNNWDGISEENKVNLAGMMSNCEDQFGNYVTDELPDSLITDYYDLYYNKGIKGEKFFCYKTDILLKNNFSTVDRYVPENVILLNISDNYQTYFFNENLRIYHIKQDDHQSLNDKLEGEWKMQFPLGMRHAKLEDINRRYRKLVKKPILFFKTLVNFSRFSYHADLSMLNSLKDINKFHLKIFVALLFPIGILIAWREKL